MARPALVRRTAPDHSQQIRRAVQLLFLGINVWIGVQFYLWVRFMEGSGRAVPRPPGVEGWLPIAALMNLKAWVLTGSVPRVHPAGMFLLVAFLTMSLLLKKAFCGWLCPVGTISESLWKLGRKLFRHNLQIPRWLDIPLRSIKYLLLAFFAFAVARMNAAAIADFIESPYGVIADVKLLDFFRTLGTTGAVVIAVIALLSLFIPNFWCRYLCPYGALLGIPSLASPSRIRRNPAACIDCAKCAKACPARLPVDRLMTVRSAECTLCMQCVASCPAKAALEVKVTPNRVLSPLAIAAIIATIFFTIVVAARATHHWQTPLPDYAWRALVNDAGSVTH